MMNALVITIVTGSSFALALMATRLTLLAVFRAMWIKR
jgi:hypothetical protein